jgi:hypothetical protein
MATVFLPAQWPLQAAGVSICHSAPRLPYVATHPTQSGRAVRGGSRAKPLVRHRVGVSDSAQNIGK